MTTLNVGDRVHLKWDHSVTGAANYVLPLESWLNVSLDGGHITSTPASWWERIPDRTVGGREKFQRGDKVRAKHDPIFTGEVCEDFGNMVEIEAAKTTMRLPAKWLERTPSRSKRTCRSRYSKKFTQPPIFAEAAWRRTSSSLRWASCFASADTVRPMTDRTPVDPHRVIKNTLGERLERPA